MSETKKIRITLAALTRVEYSEVLEVPANMTESDLDDLVSQRYGDIDGGLYQDDPEYWERGNCHHEAADATELVDKIVTVEDGDITVSDAVCLDDVAEWVGLHYKVNFEVEPAHKKRDWIERYKEMHAHAEQLREQRQ